jgi:hypothetical protein
VDAAALSLAIGCAKSELANLQKNPGNMANKLGLPPGMQVEKFDLYQIAPKHSAVAFESTIASTAVNGVPIPSAGQSKPLYWIEVSSRFL